MTQKIKTLEIYIKNLLWGMDHQEKRLTEKYSLEVINLKDKLEEIEYILNRK